MFVLILLMMMVGTASSQPAERFDVVITEIMADPSPAVSLPNAEYIEVRNRSTKTLNLQGWKLSDATSTVTIQTSIVLEPDSLLILCANSQVAAFSLFGKAIGVSSFPSLDNDGEILVLRSETGKLIHAVEYTSGWHANALKKDGGWSLEMIDCNIPCAGKTNWTSSTSSRGGTPGKDNASSGITIDHDPPKLVRTYSVDSMKIVAVFDEPLDSSSAAAVHHYTLSDGVQITKARPLAPLYSHVELVLASPMQPYKIYMLTVKNTTDCMNNPVEHHNTAKAGCTGTVETGNMVFNEILFNPKPEGADFVELYNNSNTILDASALYIAGRNATGEMVSVKKISEDPFQVYPGDYLVVTANADAILRTNLVKEPSMLLQVSSLPSMPDDKGVLVLTGVQGNIVDEVSYSEKWHYPLISNAEGVALEKLDPFAASNNAGNWHSASSSQGYATPTARNSQQVEGAVADNGFLIQPAVFSPDQDGWEDVMQIRYQLKESGYIANITIFNSQGRAIKALVRNGLLGTQGSFTWNGLDDRMQKLPIGPYIVYIEIFNLKGKVSRYKELVVLAGKR